jgi:predicted RNase H-like HicB family nuclease
MTFEIQLKLMGAVRKDAEAKVWVGYCPTLKVYSQGTDKDEATAALKDAAASFVLVCLQQKTLEQALEKRGFAPCKESPAPEKGSGEDDKREWIQIRKLYDKGEFEFSVNVPFHLIAATQASA